jgi:plasmid maintenance system antidote protein VapI
MGQHSQIANVYASPNIRNLIDDQIQHFSHTANMFDDDDKNGGPNHLKAWMRFRKKSGVDIAKAIEITPGMVSDLANSNRALSAKWLRRLAPALETTPGLLLDHDPYDLDSDIIEIWINATSDERRQLKDVAKALVHHDGRKDGTNG